MKRRGRRHLPKVRGDLDPADTARLFGDFRWNQWSPAGRLERFGFFTRQLGRNGDREGWAWGWAALKLVTPLVVGLALLAYGAARVF
jgi:hypothetical protein